MSASPSGRVPPNDLDAELAVLSAILLESSALDRVQELLMPEHFYAPAHRHIYGACIDLAREGSPIDLVTVSSFLRSRERLADVGGTPYITKIVDLVPEVANIDSYARVVREKWRVRELIQTCQRIAAEGYGDVGVVQSFIDNAEQAVYNLARTPESSSVSPLGEVIRAVFLKVEEVSRRGSAITGFPTGFKKLDELTSGLHPTDLVIVAARPGMGKCLTGDTEIVQADGSLRPLADLVAARQASVLSLRDDARLHPASPSHFVDDGIKPTFRVTTRSGRTVETTLSHPFLTVTGWRSLELLSRGDRIAVPRRLPVMGSLVWSPAEVGAAIESLGDAQAPGDALPPAAFTLSREPLAHLLSRLFGLAGRADDSPPGVELEVGSERLARQVVHLLLRFEVLTSLEPRGARWVVRLTRPDALQTFFACVGIGRSGFVERGAPTASKPSSLPLSTKLERGPGGEGAEPDTSGDIFWDEIVAIEPTGLKQVYDLTVPGTHNFVAGDVCVHNTSFVLNLAVGVAQPLLQQEEIEGDVSELPGGACAIFSLEMPREQIASRLVCSESGVDVQKMRNGRLQTEDWHQLTQTASWLSRLPIYIDDTPGISVLEVRSKLRRIQSELQRATQAQGREQKIGLVVIDYLQLMKASDRAGSREQEISEISRGLKHLAKELRVPVVALSQLNRSVETRSEKSKRPQISDLRESGAIEQDADMIMFIYRDDYYNKETTLKNIAEIIVAKQRNGPTGKVMLHWNGATTRFSDLDPGQIPEGILDE
ncbi:MAG: replicative DNA helicase [Myxococcales bacterium]|nr:MAG: replicative DNA helicase [Myxococcales bacterium]